MTEKIVAAKIAKRRHAWGVRPSGTGQSQMREAERDGGSARDPRLCGGAHFGASPARARRTSRGVSGPALDVHRERVELVVFGFDDGFPRERELALEAGPPPRPARDRPGGRAAGARGWAFNVAKTFRPFRR